MTVGEPSPVQLKMQTIAANVRHPARGMKPLAVAMTFYRFIDGSGGNQRPIEE
jgi:hypothetical protein